MPRNAGHPKAIRKSPETSKARSGCVNARRQGYWYWGQGWKTFSISIYIYIHMYMYIYIYIYIDIRSVFFISSPYLGQWTQLTCVLQGLETINQQTVTRFKFRPFLFGASSFCMRTCRTWRGTWKTVLFPLQVGGNAILHGRLSIFQQDGTWM